MGTGVVKTYSRGRAVISLSSGDSEYYSLVSVASEALGHQSVLGDMGISAGCKIHMDATAGTSLGSRRGFGKAKHISTIFLWVQDYVSTGKLRLSKKHTSEMLADVLTKPVCESVMLKALGEMMFVFQPGRHPQALRLE